MATEKNEGVKEEYKDYYMFLEELRESGVTNMLGATPYLEKEFGMGREESYIVLLNWMNNYSEISKKYYS